MMYARALGWGIMIYALVQLAWKFLLAYEYTGSMSIVVLFLTILGSSATAAWRMNIVSFDMAIVCAVL